MNHKGGSNPCVNFSQRFYQKNYDTKNLKAVDQSLEKIYMASTPTHQKV